MQQCSNAGMYFRGIPAFLYCHCRIATLLHFCILAFLVSGCVRAQARTVPEIPLDIPEPPPRIVEVTDPQAPPIIPLPDEPVRNTPARPRPSPPRAETRAPEPPKVEPVVEVPRPDDARPPNPPTLQTTSTQQEGEVERQIRALLGRAAGDLNRTNYQALSPDARTQYDTAKRFITQAEEALRAKNLVFASNIADKAAVLAAQLVGR